MRSATGCERRGTPPHRLPPIWLPSSAGPSARTSRSETCAGHRASAAGLVPPRRLRSPHKELHRLKRYDRLPRQVSVRADQHHPRRSQSSVVSQKRDEDSKHVQAVIALARHRTSAPWALVLAALAPLSHQAAALTQLKATKPVTWLRLVEVQRDTRARDRPAYPPSWLAFVGLGADDLSDESHPPLLGPHGLAQAWRAFQHGGLQAEPAAIDKRLLGAAGCAKVRQDFSHATLGSTDAHATERGFPDLALLRSREALVPTWRSHHQARTTASRHKTYFAASLPD